MNESIENYFDRLEIRIKESEVVETYTVISKIITTSEGKIKIRIRLKNTDLTDIFNYVKASDKNISIIRYGYHWQDKNGKLIKRWDNAPHHRELENFPHHVHYTEEMVVPLSVTPDFYNIIAEIEVALNK
jgi:hypothetical protein